MTENVNVRGAGLLERLEQGPVICAEGYLFEFERRGYLQAGAFVPEVVLEHPELVRELHEEFVHAGSDVVEAFTYYAHREKLRVIGREDALEEINRQALEIARDVARETGSLFAGDLSNTNVFTPEDSSRRAVRAIFDEQVQWAADAGVDFIVAETLTYNEEAMIALEAIKAANLPAVVTLAVHRPGVTPDGLTPEEACKALEAAGADVVGLELRPWTSYHAAPAGSHQEERELSGGGTPRSVPHHRGRADVPVAARSTLHQSARGTAIPNCSRSVRLQPLRNCRLHSRCLRTRSPLSGRVLWRRPTPYPQHGGGAGTNPGGQPLHRRHVQACLLRPAG